METLVFDIETIGHVADDVRPAVEKLALGREWSVERYAALCPPLARVACIGSLDAQAGRLDLFIDASLAPNPLPTTIEVEIGDSNGNRGAANVRGCAGESELIEAFGRHLEAHAQDRQSRFATFNGRGFDLPVLLHRSIALGVRPGRRVIEQLIAENRYRPQRHVDVMELATQFGASPRWPLAAYAIGYGFRSPKADMDGAEVGPAVAAGRIVDVAAYCAGDVLATAHVLARLEAA